MDYLVAVEHINLCTWYLYPRWVKSTKRSTDLLLDGWVSLVVPGPVPMISSSNSTEGEILAVWSAYTPKMVKALAVKLLRKFAQKHYKNIWRKRWWNQVNQWATVTSRMMWALQILDTYCNITVTCNTTLQLHISDLRRIDWLTRSVTWFLGSYWRRWVCP